MKRLVSLVLALVLMLVFSMGCGGTSRETKVKCPKCGAVFTIDEGLKALEKQP